MDAVLEFALNVLDDPAKLVLAMGFLAATLQGLGYLVYVTHVLRREIRPTGASWLMFAYGTTILFFIELFSYNASWSILALPAVCAISSVGVAIYCKRRGGRLLPTHAADWGSFVLDLMITVVYVSGFILLRQGDITVEQKHMLDLTLLICWNVGILTAFFPLLREVYHHPHSERSWPWIVWTSAYTLLFVTTILKEGVVNELALYPFVSMIVHAFVAHHARSHRRLRLPA